MELYVYEGYFYIHMFIFKKIFDFYTNFLCILFYCFEKKYDIIDAVECLKNNSADKYGILLDYHNFLIYGWP